MYEVEVKLRADHATLRDRLDELGATRERAIEQVDRYYDAPHRDFAATDEALRIRRVRRRDGEATAGADRRHGEGDGAEARVTYKGPLVDDASKTRLEHETGVEDGETVADILDALGFSPAATVEKHREVYALDGLTVVLDDVADLGEFVEVELESEDVDTARERCFEAVRALGLDPDDGIRTSYLGLLLDGDAPGDSPE
ncbi:class IV adenylate cyclase [Halomarina oriensis]|uniref:Class IV adenylate cyclase n=1 Tax=Halomarina oriensis TaxID=671145 RepID=A0A6B0GKF3_9EURY|nr:class IV adenylate cyclase [Halomarina oriensis]MWG33899.1 class IV adenylate cyclase [Halomarina oriensis]